MNGPSRRRVEGALGALAAVSVALSAGCASPIRQATGPQLRLDGHAFVIKATCVRSATNPCPTDGNAPPDSVTCNVSGPMGQPIIYIVQTQEGLFEISADTVDWYRGREDAILANGGVTNFNATRGADVDVMLQGHHLVGSVSCTN